MKRVLLRTCAITGLVITALLGAALAQRMTRTAEADTPPPDAAAFDAAVALRPPAPPARVTATEDPFSAAPAGARKPLMPTRPPQLEAPPVDEAGTLPAAPRGGIEAPTASTVRFGDAGPEPQGGVTLAAGQSSDLPAPTPAAAATPITAPTPAAAPPAAREPALALPAMPGPSIAPPGETRYAADDRYAPRSTATSAAPSAVTSSPLADREAATDRYMTPPASPAPTSAAAPTLAPPETVDAFAEAPRTLPVASSPPAALEPPRMTPSADAAARPLAPPAAAPATVGPRNVPGYGAPVSGGTPLPSAAPASIGSPPAAPFAAAPAPLSGSSTRGSVAASGPPSSTGTGKPGPAEQDGPQSPMLTIEKIAPPEVQIGKPATLQVIVRNEGRVTAEDVEVRDQIPAGTQLASTKPQAAAGTRGEVVWSLGALAPGNEAVLELTVIPTAEGELGSVATVRFGAAASVRTVCTRPELAVEVVANSEALVGDTLVLRITVQNRGTGLAGNVLLTETMPAQFTHEAGGELEYPIGDLKPGESRTLELALEATRAGEGTNLLTAEGDGGLVAEARTPLAVLAPALAVNLEGPKRRFLDRQATYRVTIMNPGTAPAQEVELVTYLPRGMQFVEANNSGQYDAAGHAVHWLLEELPPQEQGTVTITAIPVEAGEQRLRIETKAMRGAEASVEEAILVEGIASLVFQVVDVADPIGVGEETSYEVVVSNQGSKESTNVQITAVLPPELTAVSAEGPTRFDVVGQQVRFEPLPRLAARQETTYRIVVAGAQPGDARFRVQLLSDDMRTPVTKEESTRVYGND